MLLEQTTEEFHQSVCRNFNTSLDQVRRDVNNLREWIASQPHLPQTSSETLLTTFLIGCKNRPQRAKEKIENYYTARTKIPDFFSSRDPRDDRVQNCAKEIRAFSLPKLTPCGCRVVMASFVSGDLKGFDPPAFCKRIMAFEDIRMNRESFYNGMFIVLDGTHFSMSHAFKYTPTLAKQITHCAQDVFPVSIKAIIFINAPAYVELIVNLMKPFMKSKLFKKIRIYKEGPESLEEFFPRAILPKDYGGEEDTMDNLSNAWMLAWEEERDWFLTEGSQGAEESKRPRTNDKNKQEKHESFRTLCVD